MVLVRQSDPRSDYQLSECKLNDKVRCIGFPNPDIRYPDI